MQTLNWVDRIALFSDCSNILIRSPKPIALASIIVDEISKTKFLARIVGVSRFERRSNWWVLHGHEGELSTMLGRTNQSSFLLTFYLPEFEFLLPIRTTMTPEMEETFELIANITSLMRNKKPNFFARNIKRENTILQA